MITAAPGSQRPAPGRGPSWSRRAVLAGVGGAAAAALALSACGSSPASSPGGAGSAAGGASNGQTAITVAYAPGLLSEPLLVAMQDGYFTQQHLDVQLAKASSDQDATTLAATGKAQVAFGGFSAGMFNAIHQGHGVKVVAAMAEEAPGTAANALVGATALDKSGAVTSPAALKGEKIAVDGGAGSADAYLVAKALAPYDVSLSQVTLVNLGFSQMASALRTGTVAAAYMTAPYLGPAVSAGDGKILVGAPAGVALTGVIYGNAFAGTPAAQQFFDALAEAVDQLQGPAPSFPANLALVAQSSGESLSVLKAEPASQFSPDLAPPVSLLSDMQNVFLGDKELGYSSPIPTSSYVDSTFSAELG
jgi:NitT/TauT family transport system substrate-binding protein